MAALIRDIRIEQYADWPGLGFSIVDAADQPKTIDFTSMTAWGWIGPKLAPIFRWSHAPADDTVGLIVADGALLIPTITAAQNTPWTFGNAPYQLYLFDPAGPVGDQTIRVAEGTVFLD